MIGPGRDFKLKDISIVMSLSLHCQSRQKYRRRVVVTSPPHRRHIAATSPPHCRHIAVGPYFCQCGGAVAVMWWWQCFDNAVTLC